MQHLLMQVGILQNPSESVLSYYTIIVFDEKRRIISDRGVSTLIYQIYQRSPSLWSEFQNISIPIINL